MTTPRITPEPPPDEAAAITAAIRALLASEKVQSSPPSWRAASWASRRAGITDIAPLMSPSRRWPLSSRLPWGGREYPGLLGRGDAR
ncbi:MAG TPA: hypothetical protein VNE62_11030 [Actinomycetota bacterium]|nr:hypothetical protein [Actinomycetota bacterium]